MTPIQRKSLATLVALVFLGAACVTVNIYFPAARVEKTAEQIVDDVYQQKEPAPEKKAPGPGSALMRWLAWLGPRQAWAASATSVSNAAIRALKDEIARRHLQIRPFYQKGKVGINKDGYLVLRDQRGLAVRDLARLRRLISADNQARRRLYQEVTRALNLPGNQVGKVQRIFAGMWRAKAGGGWWIQEDNGRWHRK